MRLRSGLGRSGLSPWRHQAGAWGALSDGSDGTFHQQRHLDVARPAQLAHQRLHRLLPRLQVRAPGARPACAKRKPSTFGPPGVRRKRRWSRSERARVWTAQGPLDLAIRVHLSDDVERLHHRAVLVLPDGRDLLADHGGRSLHLSSDRVRAQLSYGEGRSGPDMCTSGDAAHRHCP